MHKKKIMIVLTTFLLLLSLCIFVINKLNFVQAVNSPEKATIKLHKRAVSVADFDNFTQGSGSESSQLANNDPINDVIFKIFDVTPYYERVLLSTMDSKAKTDEEKVDDILKASEAQRAMAYRSVASFFQSKPERELRKEGFPPFAITKTGRGKNFAGEEEDGIADFVVDQTTSNGGNTVYVIIETDTSEAKNAATGLEETVIRAINTTISLPISDEEDGDLKEIDIYPKNAIERIEKRLVPNFEESFMDLDDGIPGNSGFSSGDTDIDQTVSRSAGDPVTFEISVPIPIDFHHVIAETDANGEVRRRYLYDYLNLRDLPDTGLSFYEFDDIELGGESIYTWEKGVDSGLIGGLPFIVEYNNEDKYKATRSDMYIDVPDEVTEENTAKLEAMSGQTLVYTIIMLVNNDAPRESHINNVVGYNKVKNPYDESKTVQVSYRNADKGNLRLLGELQIDFAGILGSTRQKKGIIKHYLTNLNRSSVSNDSSLVYKRDSKVDTPIFLLDTPIFLLDPPRDPDNPESYGEEFEVDDSEYIVVFEKDFDKVEGGTGKKILSDTAAFVVKNENGRFYGGFDNRGLLHWIEITEENKLTTEALLANDKVQKFYTTDDSTKDGKITGIVDLPGLAKGNYEVVEVKAPAGYYIDKSVKGIKFEVGDDVNENPSNLNEGYGKDLNLENAGITTEKIENFKSGILPSTGWRESIIFLIFGVFIISIAIYYFVKIKRTKNTHDVA
ncbi:MAG: hypothetical protein LBI41_03695 [Lactobacillales bacterium]|nr:hypothetical protein [Lactobacillales bacterium]